MYVLCVCFVIFSNAHESNFSIYFRSDESKTGLFADMVSTFQDTQEVSSSPIEEVQVDMPILIDGEEQKESELALVVEQNERTDDAAQNKQKVEIKLVNFLCPLLNAIKFLTAIANLF